jgi:hypothetical protein
MLSPPQRLSIVVDAPVAQGIRICSAQAKLLFIGDQLSRPDTPTTMAIMGQSPSEPVASRGVVAEREVDEDRQTDGFLPVETGWAPVVLAVADVLAEAIGRVGGDRPLWKAEVTGGVIYPDEREREG